jgi:hypothetical protein
MSREDRPQRMPDKLDVVHQQDPDDLFTSHTVILRDARRSCLFLFPIKRVDWVLALMHWLDHGSILVLD